MALAGAAPLHAEPAAARTDSRTIAQVDAAGRAPEPSREHWYGWQTLATDGAAASQFALAAGTHNPAFLGLGVGTFALGAPIVHLAHHRPWMALLDLGFRVVVPLIGLSIGAEIDSHTPSTCRGSSEALDAVCEPSTKAIEAGGIVTTASVAALDAAFFSYEPARAGRPRDERDERGAKLVLAPTFALLPHGGRVGLAGSF